MNQLATEEVVEQTSTLTDLIGIDIGGIILKILWALVIVFIFILLWKLVAAMVKKNIIKHSSVENKEHAYRVADLMRDITFYIMVIFAFFIGFEMVGFNVGLILWWISFWVWLAFKEILGNMIAWMMILYTKELKLGDVIEIDADKWYFGRIEEITIRYTIIRTLDLRQVIIPNMTLISNPIRTFSAESVVKLTTEAYVHYDSDLDKAIHVIKDTINSFDFIKEKESTKAIVYEVADSEIVIKCIFFFDPNAGLLADYVKWYVHEAILKAFVANNINMAYPHTTITFENEKDRAALGAIFGDDYKENKTKI
jgi:small conductance mechanosensitive channel